MTTQPRANPSDRTYFAAEPFGSEEIGKKLLTKVEEYESHELVRRVDEKIALAYQHYFGYSPDGFHATSIVARAGDQGELAEIRINHARALVQSLLNLIIKDKFVWTPRASNFSYQAVRQTELAANVLEHYWHNHRVKQYTDSAVEEAIAFTEGYVMIEWDETAGSVSMPDPTNKTGLLRTGDIKYRNISTWDVIRDPYSRSWEDLRYIICRVMTNRFEVMAKIERNPDLDDTQKDLLLEKVRAVNNSPYTGSNKARTKDWESDEIPVFRFFHKPDAILQHGRETHFLADGTVIKDKVLDLDFIPVFRCAPAELIGTPFGYSQYLEILGLQEMSDAIHSALATNISTFATQSIILEEGSNIQVEDLAGGMKVLYRQAGSEHKDAIMPLQLTKSPSEAFAYVETLKNQQELLMGLNETVRGQVQSDRLSGSAMALLDTQALRQASALAGNYIRLVQELGTATIRFIRKFASVPLKISMVGKSKMSLIRETSITGKDLSEVDQVFVDIGNPMTQTAAGRFDLASQMMQMKLLTTPDGVIEVLETGRLEAVTQKKREELRNILRENEMMIEGQTPVVMLHDDHLLHGSEHSNPVSSPEARLNPGVVEAYTNHMHGHYLQYFGVPPGQYVPDPKGRIDESTGQPRQVFMQTDPLYRERMLILSGQPPPPPMMPQGPPGMPPQGPQPGPKPAQGEGGDPNLPWTDAPEAGPGAEPANLPKQPQNPSTGERWNPTDGGGATGPATP